MVIHVVFSTSQGFYKLAYDIYLHLSELVRTDRILVTHVVYCNANCPASGHSLILPGLCGTHPANTPYVVGY